MSTLAFLDFKRPIGSHLGAVRPLRILHIQTDDLGGGAAQIAWSLSQQYRARGHSSWMAVGTKIGDDPDVLPIPHGLWHRFWDAVPGGWRIGRSYQWLTKPAVQLDSWRGMDGNLFRYPESRSVLSLAPERPNIVHCHNLHGWYFDLRTLSRLSRELPVFITAHDQWLLTGHCAYTLGCERWKTGCGSCPDLTIYPAIEKDVTADSWRRKQTIYAKSRLYVATPSQWLMDQVRQSMLACGVVQSRVIHNGVDLAVFCPGDMHAERWALGLPHEAKILLFVAHDVRRNVFKDFDTLRAAASLVADRLREKILLIGLGDKESVEHVGEAEIRTVPFRNDRESVAQYYRAADIYVHAAKNDNFPNTILEALACGKPVLATAVDGIPEQVRALGISDDPTGALVPKGDAHAMASFLGGLLGDDSLRHRLGENAAKDARQRFDLRRQADAYLEWYNEILESTQGAFRPHTTATRAER
jgi:glycosyltransferase involved in cell wall biosynthesis